MNSGQKNEVMKILVYVLFSGSVLLTKGTAIKIECSKLLGAPVLP